MTEIIAECCQNHNGDMSILRDMVWTAAQSGADYIKIQSMLADDLTFRERFENGIVENGITRVIHRPYKAEYQRLKPLDLTDDAHHEFISECKKANIKPMTTVFSNSRIPFLSGLDWDAIKVASYDCGSVPMLEELKKNFKHIYVSTGASFDNEIEQAASILSGCDFSFLHCVTIYPTPLEQIHLARMDWIRQFCGSVGFSDHSLVSRDGIKASLAAIYYGADVIERHYSILKPEETRDGAVSVNPTQLKEIVDFSKLDRDTQKIYIQENVPEFESMIGQKNRELSDAEMLNRDYYRGRFASKFGDKTVFNWERK